LERNNLIGITGSTGSIGSYASNFQETISIKSRLESNLQDIVSELKEKKVHSLIHLAGLSDPEECKKNPDYCYFINVNCTRKFYEAANIAGIKRFLFVSSGHVYDFSNPCPYDIKSPVNPTSVYGKSKLDAELALLENKLDTQISIARVFSTLNKHSRGNHLYGKLHQRAASKNLSPIHGLNKIRDFLPASDVMKFLIKIIKSKSFVEKVNVCSGKGQTIGDLAYKVFAEYGLEDRVKEIKNIEDNSPSKIIGVPSDFL
jgi:nucleoside-diphosphate-sugar epimerase